MRPAREAEIRAAGAEPGYGSAIGVRTALVVADDSVPASPNLVAGANQTGYHVKNVNYGRDYGADLVCDISAAREGDPCVECAARMRARRGVEVGNIFQLGTRYTESMGGTYMDAGGEVRPVVMGSYGIGVGRLLACIAEAHHDDQGLVWPVSVAPFQVHLVALAKGRGPAAEAAERCYSELQAAGIEVLMDDRPESPGVKFNDADLIGVPVRLTVGERSLKRRQVEMKLRRARERVDVPLPEVVSRVVSELAALRKELEDQVVDVAFEA